MNVIQQVRNHELIVGDGMSTKISKDETVGSNYHNLPNRNGQFLLDLVRKKDIKLRAFAYPNNHEAQLNYVLIKKEEKQQFRLSIQRDL